MRAARTVLIGGGVAGLALAAWILVTTVSTRGLGGLGVWLVAAVVLHDAILSPVVLVANRALRRAGHRIPGVVLAIVQVTVVVGVVMTLIVLPEIRAQQLGTRNPTVLPFDYGLRLGLLWAVLGVLAALASVVALRIRPARIRPA